MRYLSLNPQTPVWRSAGAWVWAEQHYIIQAGLLSNQIFEKIIQKIYPDFVQVFLLKKLTNENPFVNIVSAGDESKNTPRRGKRDL